MPELAESFFVIDLRGKTPEEVVGLLAFCGLETSCSDINHLYQKPNFIIREVIPDIAKVKCVWIDWREARRFYFVLWDGRTRSLGIGWDLHLFHYKNGEQKWGMANTGYMMK